MSLIRNILIWPTFFLITACSNYGVIDNTPLQITDNTDSYSIGAWAKQGEHDDDIDLMLSFSGGGTRAAALSYGVMQGLRDTRIPDHDKSARMLDKVDYISSVSGGSFTAAYYGLYRDKLFDDFEDEFLLHNVQEKLFHGLFNPGEWFSRTGRTEMAARYYNERVFKGATFADMKLDDGPVIIINASELGYGVRFSFIQEYFDLLCSDINSFPVAKAVAASSAVPVVFMPIVLEKYNDCSSEDPPWLKAAKALAKSSNDKYLDEIIAGADTLHNNENIRYIHMVDGGITDNMGLHAAIDIVTLTGGAEQILKEINFDPPSHLIVILVNASTHDPQPDMVLTNEEPSLSETINAISSVQLHRYNTSTLEIMKSNLKKWAKNASTPEHPVDSYFIHINLRDIADPEERNFFNTIPTSFSLTKEQVDKLINAGNKLLHENSEYQRLVLNLGGKY